MLSPSLADFLLAVEAFVATHGLAEVVPFNDARSRTLGFRSPTGEIIEIAPTTIRGSFNGFISDTQILDTYSTLLKGAIARGVVRYNNNHNNHTE